MDTWEQAPRPFINRLLSNFKCQLQRTGTTIMKQDCEVDSVFFVYKGAAMVTRDLKSPIYGKT